MNTRDHAGNVEPITPAEHRPDITVAIDQALETAARTGREAYVVGDDGRVLVTLYPPRT